MPHVNAVMLPGHKLVLRKGSHAPVLDGDPDSGRCSLGRFRKYFPRWSGRRTEPVRPRPTTVPLMSMGVQRESVNLPMLDGVQGSAEGSLGRLHARAASVQGLGRHTL